MTMTMTMPMTMTMMQDDEEEDAEMQKRHDAEMRGGLGRLGATLTFGVASLEDRRDIIDRTTMRDLERERERVELEAKKE